MTRRLWFLGLFLVLLLLPVGKEPVPVQAQASGFLHTDGSALVNAQGNPVVLTGINWFGLETESFAPHGLWARNWESILDQVRELGFNTIRLPYSNELLEPGSMPNSINYDLNPDLEGLSGLEIMDKVVEGAGERGIKIILDRHRPGSTAQSELWYTVQYDEQRWIDDWVMLAERYAGNDTVIGADLHNEPHGPATWGTGEEATDWRLAAERAGNAILAANPDWLIIVQGIEQYEGDWYWWGGNLMGAREHQVRLDVPNRLVYSSHVYGPGVYPQPWFDVPEFPDNLARIWDEHWGYLARDGIAPVIVGEFGGRSVGADSEGIWQRALFAYLREHSLSYFYWTLNPNSGDTGGLLLDDWESVDPEKQELLESYQFPPLGEERVTVEPFAGGEEEEAGAGAAEPTEMPVTGPAPDMEAGALQVQLRMPYAETEPQDARPEFIIANNSRDAVPLAHVEVFYWLGSSDDDLVFHCDWAAVGCSNVIGAFESTPDGTQYLRIWFRPEAGRIEPAGDSGEVKVRFNREDWSAFPQQEHYSFNGTTEYEVWERITLAVDGRQVWGVAPEEAVQEPAETATATVTPPTPTPEPPTRTATPEEQIAQGPDVTETPAAATPTPGVAAPSGPVSSGFAIPGSLWFAAVACAAVSLLALGVVVGMVLSRRGKDA